MSEGISLDITEPITLQSLTSSAPISVSIAEPQIAFDVAMQEVVSIYGKSVSRIELEGEFDASDGAVNSYIIYRDDDAVLGTIQIKNGSTGESFSFDDLTEEQKAEIRGVTSYKDLSDLPTIGGKAIVGDYILGEGLGIQDKTISLSDDYCGIVRVASTADWSVDLSYRPKKNQLIIYSDYMTVNGINYAGVKIGDGKAYLIDLPFIHGSLEPQLLELKSSLESHLADTASHVSAEDREYWNGKNKVSESVVNETLNITL